ncbi:MAG TPA: Zn-dependent hydrolase [Burkholderiaceae bacterium]|nr:Zn-dependent hydrolase [Burkholderiaceae bacterium]
MKAEQLRIDPARLMARLNRLAEIGRTDDGSCCRLALTDEDRAGRDLVSGWMRDLGLEVRVDAIGNIFGLRRGTSDVAPVMTGSHIDTVRTGGRYDGNLGVLGGLEVVQVLNDAGITMRRPLVVGVFTDEEGARFHPDMAGSLTYVGGLPLEELYATRSIDGRLFRDELQRIGYLGDAPVPLYKPHAFVELHIEQGPVLDIEGITIGAVENLQGISWTEVLITGQSNHAGTTPMRLRHDAGYCAAEIGAFARRIARELGGSQVGTVGSITLHPNLVNVIAARARVTVDLRNTDDAVLVQAERRLTEFLAQLARDEGVKIETHSLARFAPVIFDKDVAGLIARTAQRLGHSCRPMTSGAGHDAQMMARMCPTAMIFVPSVRGISHNPAEHTEPAHLAAGADVLLHTLLELTA